MLSPNSDKRLPSSAWRQTPPGSATCSHRAGPGPPSSRAGQTMGTGVSQQGPGLEWALGHLGLCARKKPARGVPLPTSADRRPEVEAGGDASAPSLEAGGVRGLCRGGPGPPGGSVASSPPPAPCPSPRGPLIGLPGSPLTRESKPPCITAPQTPSRDGELGPGTVVPWACSLERTPL